MSNNFDDYVFKDNSRKYKLKIKQVKEKKLNPWEISSFLNRFNTYYYKDELFNTISLALMKNIEPENIFIFDQSFKLNQIYSNLNYVDFEGKSLKHLYYIGLPVSLYPNEKIIALNLLFKYFRQYNVLLSTIKKSNRLKINELSLYYKIYNETDDFNMMCEKIKEDVYICLENIVLEKSQKLALKKIDSNIKNSYRKYLDDKDLIIIVKNKIERNENVLTDREQVILKRYFNKFFYYLNNIQRPLVVVKNTESKNFTILCRAQVNKKESRASTLDLKSFSHNSPIEAIIKGSISLYRIFVQGNRETKISQKLEIINNINSYIEDNQLLEEEIILEQQKIEKLQIEINSLREIQNIENQNPRYSENIPNLFIKENIQNQEQTNLRYSGKILAESNFEEDLTDFNFEIEF
ncbi:hypothetical protein [Arcobacter sp. L]|uniref:hypothetical protein n=1 Tax=Arcobacter sp. L TaxID=944547 RepID=UPI000229603A|nr:hypothetical protein [Arcobacter sp. L]BAK74041.1 conserved hypothetical protein [Arcobacter sp. L]